jgi:hypothetical protein
MPEYVTRSFRYARDPKFAAIKARILKRDDFLCRYCTDWADTVDHVLPHSFGGTDHDDNLVAACRFCNHKASDKVFDSFEHKHAWLQEFIPEKIKRERKRLCICCDCGELFEYRKYGATAVLCQICARRDDQDETFGLTKRERQRRIRRINAQIAEERGAYA